MDCAANYGHAKLIQLLIERSAPIDPKDRSLVIIIMICMCVPWLCGCISQLNNQ